MSNEGNDDAKEPPSTAEHVRSTRSSKRLPDTDLSGNGNTKRVKQDGADPSRRPTALEYLEDYVEFSSDILLPSVRSGSGGPSYHHSLPIVSALHFLKSPQRRRLVWEDWSPYQISLFEAGIAYHGKDFYAISKEFDGQKSTQQVIDFYYAWKKTSHYQTWQKTYLPKSMDEDDSSSCSMEEPEDTSTQEAKGKAGSHKGEK